MIAPCHQGHSQSHLTHFVALQTLVHWVFRLVYWVLLPHHGEKLYQRLQFPLCSAGSYRQYISTQTILTPLANTTDSTLQTAGIAYAFFSGISYFRTDLFHTEACLFNFSCFHRSRIRYQYPFCLNSCNLYYKSDIKSSEFKPSITNREINNR